MRIGNGDRFVKPLTAAGLFQYIALVQEGGRVGEGAVVTSGHAVGGADLVIAASQNLVVVERGRNDGGDAPGGSAIRNRVVENVAGDGAYAAGRN